MSNLPLLDCTPGYVAPTSDAVLCTELQTQDWGHLHAAMRCSLMHNRSMCLHAQDYWQNQERRVQCATRLPHAPVAVPHNAPSTACKATALSASLENLCDKPCEATGNQQQQNTEDESSTHSEEALLNVIKGYLQDPGFQEEVDRMEELWERAEGQLLAEAGLDGDKQG